MTSRYSSGEGSEERLQFVIDIVAGDVSGLDEIQQLEARLRQTGESLHGTFADGAKASFQTFADAGKTAMEPLIPMQANLQGIIDKQLGIGSATNSARDSFRAFADNGLAPANEQLKQQNSHISGWLVNAANMHGALGNIGSGLANIGPQFAELGKSIPEVGFGLAGLIIPGGNAALAIGNLASVGFRTFTDLGKQAGEFYNQMVVGAEVTGMNTKQYANMTAAADIAGVSISQLTVISQRLTKTQEDLANGVDNKATTALKNLDIQIKNTDGTLSDSYDVLQRVAGAIDKKASETEKLAAVEQLFGLRGKEALALLEDLNTVLPIASGLVNEHSGAYDNLKEKQQAYNTENERMKQNWNNLISSVGPAYTAMLKGVNDEMDRLSGHGGRGTNVGAQGSTVFTDENGDQWAIDNMTGAPFKLTGGGKKGYPSEDDSANQNIAGLEKTGSAGSFSPFGPYDENQLSRMIEETQKAEADSHKKDTWNPVLGQWQKNGAGGGASGGFSASELDRSDIIANQFAGILAQLTQNMPTFNLDLQHMAVNVAAWDAANKQYSDRIDSIKAQISEQTALQGQLTLTGRQYTMSMDAEGHQHKVLTDEYQASQDKIKALQVAENTLTSARISNVLLFTDVVKMETEAVKAMAKEAMQARAAFAQATLMSMGSVRAGSAYVTGINADGSSYGAIVGPEGGPELGGTITSINGKKSDGSNGLINTGTPGAADGGYVEAGGLAIIHKGEVISSAGSGKGAGGGDVYNIILPPGSPRDSADYVMNALIQLGLQGRVNLSPN